jgi:hypothetical protein
VLENFAEIDINFIGENCLNLGHLALSNITSFTPIVHLRQVRLILMFKYKP